MIKNLMKIVLSVSMVIFYFGVVVASWLVARYVSTSCFGLTGNLEWAMSIILFLIINNLIYKPGINSEAELKIK